MYAPRGAWSWLMGATALATLLASPAHAAPKPLFASDDQLNLRIEAPFAQLLHTAPHSTAGYDAKLTVLAGTPETLAIKLSPRGISRRNPTNCDFPPLRIELLEMARMRL